MNAQAVIHNKELANSCFQLYKNIISQLIPIKRNSTRDMHLHTQKLHTKEKHTRSHISFPYVCNITESHSQIKDIGIDIQLFFRP